MVELGLAHRRRHQVGRTGQRRERIGQVDAVSDHVAQHRLQHLQRLTNGNLLAIDFDRLDRCQRKCVLQMPHAEVVRRVQARQRGAKQRQHRFGIGALHVGLRNELGHFEVERIVECTALRRRRRRSSLQRRHLGERLIVVELKRCGARMHRRHLCHHIADVVDVATKAVGLVGVVGVELRVVGKNRLHIDDAIVDIVDIAHFIGVGVVDVDVIVTLLLLLLHCVLARQLTQPLVVIQLAVNLNATHALHVHVPLQVWSPNFGAALALDVIAVSHAVVPMRRHVERLDALLAQTAHLKFVRHR